ncbi:MAG: LptF/LptG family permease [Spirochaetaceae bacterium]|jgi:lipopolysaccharide export LptBFGC system permease protein LptF|nr:LptF/LptG family permease [Spirochaetaceae bacterium]
MADKVPGFGAVLYKTVLVYFCAAFVFFFFIFSVNQVALLARLLWAAAPAGGQLVRLFLYSMPSVIVMSIPYAALVGFLLALIVCNARSSMAAYKKQIIASVVCLGVVCSLLNFAIGELLLPKSVDSFSELYAAVAGIERGEYVSPRSQRVDAIIAGIDTIKKERPHARFALNLHFLELHKKFSLPLGALCFAVLAIPCALVLSMRKKTAFALGLAVCLANWALLMAGEKLAEHIGSLGAAVMWFPNVLALVAAVLLWVFVARRLS